MSRIKLPIMDRLLRAGYLPVQRGRYVEWTRGNSDSVWFDRQAIQASSNNKGSEIIKRLVGKPDIQLSDNQRGSQDIWYTDGYLGRSYYNQLIESLDAVLNRLTEFLKPHK